LVFFSFHFLEFTHIRHYFFAKVSFSQTEQLLSAFKKVFTRIFTCEQIKRL